MYFDVLGTPLLSINSFEAASDLLDKKGSIYSDRPRMPMVKELYVHRFITWKKCLLPHSLGWTWNLVLQSYSEGFAVQRKMVQQKLQQTVVTSQYRPVIAREVKAMLHRLQASPDAFTHHLKRYDMHIPSAHAY